jgi:hypothetical protein
MYTFKTIIAALVLLLPTALGHAQAINPSQAAIACTTLGDLFHDATDARDRGVSLKDDLDLSAKAAQIAPDPRMSPLDFVRVYSVIAVNARWNPQYQHTGPSMNKLLAESRCTSIGPKAFYAELVAIGQTLFKQ